MHTVVRMYSGRGAKDLADALTRHKAEVEQLMRPIKGFVSYTVAHTGDGCVSVTVCQTKAGADDSVAKARDWIKKRVPNLDAGTMAISEGEVILHLK